MAPRINISLSDSLIESIKKRAADKGLSVSGYIAFILRSLPDYPESRIASLELRVSELESELESVKKQLPR